MNWLLFNAISYLLLPKALTAFTSIGFLLCAAYQSNTDVLDLSKIYTENIVQCTACYSGFVLVDGYCYCPQGSYINLDTAAAPSTYSCYVSSSIPYCIAGVYQANAVHCNRCGYGRRLNLAPTTCSCTGLSTLLTSGDCTTIPHCNDVRYINSTNEECLSCKTTFQLHQGKCICPHNTTYDSASLICKNGYDITPPTTGCILSVSGTCIKCGYGLKLSGTHCVCNGVVIQGGCTSIHGCNYVQYLIPSVQQCISCQQSFTLQANKCICAAGSHFNTTLSKCELSSNSNSNTNLSNQNSNSQNPSNLNSLSNIQITIFLGVITTFLLISLIILFFLIKTVYCKNQLKQISPVEHNKQQNNNIQENQQTLEELKQNYKPHIADSSMNNIQRQFSNQWIIKRRNRKAKLTRQNMNQLDPQEISIHQSNTS